MTPVEKHICERNKLIEADLRYSLNDEDFDLSVDELAVQKILEELVGNDKVINPRINFLEQVDQYETSELVQLCKTFPKGAHLHVHNISAGCFRKLSATIKKLPDLYVCLSEGDATYIYGSFHFFEASNIPTELNFKPAKDCEEDFIFSLITVPTEFKSEEEKKKFFNNPWGIFQDLWTRIFSIAANSLLYDGKDSFFYQLLEDQYSSGVRYLELRSFAMDIFHKGTKKISPKEYFSVSNNTVKLFKKDHPAFIGCRQILCSVKAQPNNQIHDNILMTAELANDAEVGSSIAGYDLVGEEDTLRPIGDYIKELQFCGKCGLDLFLHAGETNDSSTFALYDAYLLDSKRLGHAYDLVNHPLLMEEVKKRSMCVECCPISNQVLGYCEDMRNHNGKTLVRHGLFVTINADDPGMFKYWDVSYDWALVIKSWGLSLMQIKSMCRKSLSAARLTPVELQKAHKNFDADWDQFLEDTLKKHESK